MLYLLLICYGFFVVVVLNALTHLISSKIFVWSWVELNRLDQKRGKIQTKSGKTLEKNENNMFYSNQGLCEMWLKLKEGVED